VEIRWGVQDISAGGNEEGESQKHRETGGLTCPFYALEKKSLELSRREPRGERREYSGGQGYIPPAVRIWVTGLDAKPQTNKRKITHPPLTNNTRSFEKRVSNKRGDVTAAGKRVDATAGGEVKKRAGGWGKRLQGVQRPVAATGTGSRQRKKSNASHFGEEGHLSHVAGAEGERRRANGHQSSTLIVSKGSSVVSGKSRQGAKTWGGVVLQHNLIGWGGKNKKEKKTINSPKVPRWGNRTLASWVWVTPSLGRLDLGVPHGQTGNIWGKRGTELFNHKGKRKKEGKVGDSPWKKRGGGWRGE